MVLVFAGNHQQYTDWVQKNHLNPKFYRYVSDVTKIQGLRRGTPYVRVGTFYQHPHWHDFYEYIILRDLHEMTTKEIVQMENSMFDIFAS